MFFENIMIPILSERILEKTNPGFTINFSSLASIRFAFFFITLSYNKKDVHGISGHPLDILGHIISNWYTFIVI